MTDDMQQERRFETEALTLAKAASKAVADLANSMEVRDQRLYEHIERRDDKMTAAVAASNAELKEAIKLLSPERTSTLQLLAACGVMVGIGLGIMGFFRSDAREYVDNLNYTTRSEINALRAVDAERGPKMDNYLMLVGRFDEWRADASSRYDRNEDSIKQLQSLTAETRERLATIEGSL